MKDKALELMEEEMVDFPDLLHHPCVGKLERELSLTLVMLRRKPRP